MKNKVIYVLVIIVIFFVTFFVSYKFNLESDYSIFTKILSRKFNSNSEFKLDFISLYIKNMNQEHFVRSNELVFSDIEIKEDDKPIIYIYNTHSNEEYKYDKNNSYNIIPTVKTASLILESELKKIGINSIVESENITNIVNQKKLNYADSYKISRIFLEKRLLENDTLNYFIDIHRDSVSNTTIEIDGIKYAKILFILGLENENYLENKKIIERLDNYLNANYKGLSKGIYEKQGAGVDGIYNQDFNPNTLLIEVGGVDNDISEVSNSIKIIARGIYDIVNN